MNREEVLAKSREENKNKDIYEQEVLKQANKSAVMVHLILAAIFSVTQILAGGGINWGLWALVCSTNMTVFWVKYIKLRRRHELMMAVIYTIFVTALSGCHIFDLIIGPTISQGGRKYG